MTLDATANRDIGGMAVRFWGVRGSVPTPVAENLAHGGNTCCVEVRLAGESLILDAGTGIRGLGAAMAAAGQTELHLFLTHFHWDHIQGLPFFAPLYDATSAVTLYAARPTEETAAILAGQMVGPYFPIGFEALSAQVRFVDVREKAICLGDAEVTSFALNHPQGCHGYAIRQGGRKVVFASDLEFGDAKLDQVLIEAAEGADLLIFDAQFTPEEYEVHRGWGHSSWQHAVRVAREAGVRRLVLFHHDPSHGQEQMEAILRAAQAEFTETSLAIEGETVLV